MPSRVPRAAWSCALVASLSAACWSVITPPFQAPDEPSHFAYAQGLAETGRLPTTPYDTFSPEEQIILRDLDQTGVRWHPEVKTITSPAAQRQLQSDLERPLSRVGQGGAGVAASEPPLYYALETIPYFLGSSGTLLTRLQLMRLLSALMAGITALFTFLFVRECLPEVPWAWVVGGLAAAIAPLLGFTSGVVTPDAMLFAVSAAAFYGLARAFRRGLTRGMAVAIGATIATGFLTKVNFVGLAPGLMLGLVVLGFRGIPAGTGVRRSKRAFGQMALAMAISVSPVVLYALRNVVEHRSTLGIVSSAFELTRGHGSLLSDLVYVWQLYLPRIPGMVNYFPGISPLRQIWFVRAVGLYGWLDTSFPPWVYNIALVPAALIAILALRSLVTKRSALRARASELFVYLAMSAGLMALIGQDSHLHRLTEGGGYAQPRYLMPLLPLAAALLALAARGAGRRWGPAVGALIVVLFLAQDVFSQLLEVARFYS
jgi:4-amino-4-deoxy-L-arabinose transferase-like glycosyltransferase